MTRAEALAEAQKRWGAPAFVHRHRKPNGEIGQYQVGYIWGGDPSQTTYFHGDSWEAAFRDADIRQEGR